MAKPVRVLVLEPFGGGSHATFYGGWSKHSQHHFTTCELPPNHWKWRSRHAAFSFAEQAMQLCSEGAEFDVVFCSSMLELPVWRGLVSEQLSRLPAVAYFHENQFTYPLTEGQQRDYHYAYSNTLTAMAAQRVWFNSSFHLQQFYSAAAKWLRRMPSGKQHLERLACAKDRSFVRPPGIHLPSFSLKESHHSSDSAPVVGWVARWEHDKAPERFLEAVKHLIASKVEFRLCLLGERFRNSPSALAEIETLAGDRIIHNGYASSADEYWQLLASIDFVVSTARHEFFGIGIVEAMAAGAIPIVPESLAYPEVLELAENPARQEFFYNPSSRSEHWDSLGEVLQRWIEVSQWRAQPKLVDRARAFDWRHLAVSYDQELEALVD